MPGSSLEDVYVVNPAHVRPSSPAEVAVLESELDVAFGDDRKEVRRELGPGLDLAGSVHAVAELGEHAHVVELGERTTFFLPALGARLSLSQLNGRAPSLDLSHDPEADPVAVARLLAVLGAG